MARAPVIAVDIGGTKVSAALVRDGMILLERAQVATPREDVSGGLVPAVRALVAPWLAQVSAVGVATTGYVNQGRVSAVNPATLPLAGGLEIARLLSETLGRRVHVVNDGQAATWGEYRHGAGAGTSDFAFLTVSTGVGGGVVSGGRLVSGPRGFAGHVGHTVVQRDGPRCGCGRRGCVEAIASGNAMAARAVAVLGASIGVPELLERAENDPRCRAMVEDAADAVAQLCLNLVAALDVERIAMGGGIGLNPLFAHRVEGKIAAAPALFRVPVVPAQLGADAGLVGAAALAADMAR
jgi:N-acylmannosamine kinase